MFNFISFHFVLFPFLSFHFISLPFCFVSFPVISFHFVLFPFLSFHCISLPFHFILFRFRGGSVEYNKSNYCTNGQCFYRQFNAEVPPQMWYMVKSFYLLLSAYQIRRGYPARVIGNVLCKRYSVTNMVMFKG